MTTGNAVTDFVWEIGPAWRDRVHAEDSIVVEAGSELDDPVLLPGDVPIAKVVWRLLADGGSHFYAHDTWMRAATGGMLLKSSATLGRAAAVCASRALYILTGEGQTKRRVRALQIMNDEVEGLDKIAKAHAARKSPAAAEQTEMIESYRNQVEEALEALGEKRRSAKSDTALFAEAVDYFPPEKRAKAELEITTMWQIASGMAHGRLFTWDTGMEDEDIAHQLAFAWGIPAQLLEMSWDHWNVLRGVEERS